jgi:hypothetical protein
VAPALLQILWGIQIFRQGILLTLILTAA